MIELGHPLLIFGLPTTVVVIGLVLVVLALWQSVEIVQAYEKRALTVFGEYRRLLDPGINLVPPLVNTTYTFDMRTQTISLL